VTGPARGGRPPTTPPPADPHPGDGGPPVAAPSSSDPDAAETDSFKIALNGFEGLVAPRVPFGVADELAWYYDAPGEPSNVHLEARVPGHLDGAALRAAAGAALAAQPRALVRRAARGWWRRGQVWEVAARPDRDPVTTATWADEEELARERERFLAAAPSLDRSPPLRVLLAAGPGEDRIILNAHHSALDGLSCLELLRSIARHYPGEAGAGAGAGSGQSVGGAGSGGANPSPSAAAAIRGPGPAPVGRGRDDRVRSPGWLPSPVARIAADRLDDGGRDRSGSVFRLLPPRPVPTARPGRATVNDLLIAALIAAIARWNADHGRPAGRIRITMPVNSRLPGSAGAAGNLSRLTSVTALPPAGRDAELGALIADVAGQTRSAKDHAGPQVDPVSRAWAAAWAPPAVKRRLLRLGLRTAGALLCDTSLLSNLGVVADPPRFGGLAATGLWFSTSAHMPRGVSAGAVTIGGQLHVCLRCRRALFGESAAARFADAYGAALDDITGPRRPL
jgi:NRPS condensation-like uncharacterized protein